MTENEIIDEEVLNQIEDVEEETAITENTRTIKCDECGKIAFRKRSVDKFRPLDIYYCHSCFNIMHVPVQEDHKSKSIAWSSGIHSSIAIHGIEDKPALNDYNDIIKPKMRNR